MDTNLKLKTNYSNISLTAYRAIKIIKMLIEKPCSINEIIEALKKDEITCKSISDDTLRATLNSLKLVGCDISRPCPTNHYKYILKSHLFLYKIKPSQLKILNKIRKYFLDKNDRKTVVEINKFYEKFFNYLQDENAKNYAPSPFYKIKPEILELLTEDRLENKEVILTYATTNKRQSDINISIDKIFCEAGKIYLWAWYPKRNAYSYFNAEKILAVHKISNKEKDTNPNFYTAKYKITGDVCKDFECEPEEKIIENRENEIIVEYLVKNEFKFFQRLLNFGTDFDLLSPEHCKFSLKKKIESVKARYLK